MVTKQLFSHLQHSDPRTYEGISKVIDALNGLNVRVGADPTGLITPPSAVGSVSVTAANGIFDAAITDKSPVTHGIEYFLEYDASPSFANATTIHLGPARNWRGYLGNATLYWRAYSSYRSSPPSPHIPFGAPTAVVGGGSAGPTIQNTQGSGTSPLPGYGFGGPSIQTPANIRRGIS